MEVFGFRAIPRNFFKTFKTAFAPHDKSISCADSESRCGKPLSTSGLCVHLFV